MLTSREIDGGVEKISTSLPLIIGGQKGLVEENDLKIPNMRGIMMARKKELLVLDPGEYTDTLETDSFEKPEPKGEVTLVSPDEVEKLIELLNNEAFKKDSGPELIYASIPGPEMIKSALKVGVNNKVIAKVGAEVDNRFAPVSYTHLRAHET